MAIFETIDEFFKGVNHGIRLAAGIIAICLLLYVVYLIVTSLFQQ